VASKHAASPAILNGLLNGLLIVFMNAACRHLQVQQKRREGFTKIKQSGKAILNPITIVEKSCYFLLNLGPLSVTLRQ